MSKAKLHEPYNKLKGYAKEHGIKYAQIANLLSISSASVSKKINGESDFLLREYLMMQKAYGVDVSFFV